MSFATTSGIPYCYHNSFYGNSAGATGGAIYFYIDQATGVLYLWNSIYWHNQPNQFEYDGPNAIMAMYCDIEGGAGQSWFGNGCIDQDPLFEDPENNNLLLTWANYPVNDNTKSPCIDAGDPEFPNDPDGSIADMGAYYFGAGLDIHDPDSHSVKLFPNPAYNSISLEQTIEGPYTVEIYSLKGQRILQSQELDKETQIDISQFHAGTYLIRIISKEMSIFTHRFIKQ
jgi:hypothetical protein